MGSCRSGMEFRSIDRGQVAMDRSIFWSGWGGGWSPGPCMGPRLCGSQHPQTPIEGRQPRATRPWIAETVVHQVAGSLRAYGRGWRSSSPRGLRVAGLDFRRPCFGLGRPWRKLSHAYCRRLNATALLVGGRLRSAPYRLSPSPLLVAHHLEAHVAKLGVHERAIEVRLGFHVFCQEGRGLNYITIGTVERLRCHSFEGFVGGFHLFSLAGYAHPEPRWVCAAFHSSILA